MSSRCAAASIWSCTRSPAITKPIRSTPRTFSKGSPVERLVDRLFAISSLAGPLRARRGGARRFGRARLARRARRVAARAQHGAAVAWPVRSQSSCRRTGSPLKDVVAVVVDRSGSQDIGERPAQTDKARDEIEARLESARRGRLASRRNVARGIRHRRDQTVRSAARRAR